MMQPQIHSIGWPEKNDAELPTEVHSATSDPLGRLLKKTPALAPTPRRSENWLQVPLQQQLVSIHVGSLAALDVFALAVAVVVPAAVVLILVFVLVLVPVVARV